jgi:carboxyl-terminal processing protease
MGTFLKSFLIAILLFLFLGAVFFAGYAFHASLQPEDNFTILDQAYQILKDNGLKEIPPDPKMEYGMIKGMLQTYDDAYTIFLEPVQHELQTDSLQGRFGGIGARIEKADNGNWLLFPLPGGPAERANIQEGDILQSVDKLQVTDQTSQDTILAALRGPVGSPVTLTILRKRDQQPVELTLKREEIELPSVTWNLIPDQPNIGIMHVNLIADSTGQEIQEAVLDLKQKGATHFMLDLRDNPGGLLTAGVDVARLFLQEGVVLEQQYRGKDKQVFYVDKPGDLVNLPLVILINQNSASAAEIIAGALKAQNRAKLVGTNTFGKDSIQVVFNLHDQSSLHVTAAKWWIPGINTPIGNGGIQPDLFIDPTNDPNAPDPIILAATQILLTPEKSDNP